MSHAISLWAGLAVLGFAMIFAVPRRALPGIVLLAISAHLIRALCQEAGAGLPLASFVAALGIGLTAAIVAPRSGQATPVYAFAPVIPLIPGTYMFNALTAILELTSPDHPPDITAMVDAAAVDVVTATLTIIALAVGAISPTLVLGRRLARITRAPDGAIIE